MRSKKLKGLIRLAALSLAVAMLPATAFSNCGDSILDPGGTPVPEKEEEEKKEEALKAGDTSAADTAAIADVSDGDGDGGGGGE